MKNSPTSTFLLGLWLGGSVVVLGVVGYNFAGIDPIFEVNPKLAEQAGFDSSDDNAKKTSALWVFASELNRAFFRYWNPVQLGLGVLTLLVVLIRVPRPLSLVTLLLSIAIVTALLLVLEPKLVELGRSIDFVSRVPELPPALVEFQRMHRIYSGLEIAKGVLLLVALFSLLRGYPAKGK